MPIVFAAPGRLFPHPSGHTRNGARFVGRGFDPSAAAGASADERWPIDPEGVEMPQTSDLHRALEQGDLLAAPATTNE